ncbi:MAG: hypothetical protein E6R03_15645 [Hyphomicrobiaceae bacterium]|nr:MAG: hypothetical protein E6R03_15645 [Hyphomicrobiaceae bacterium]
MSQPSHQAGLILDGIAYSCASPVLNWYQHGLETKIGGNNKKRKPGQIVDLFVVHWTGGTGDASRLFRVLGTRELGVEFFIDYDGTIYQFCDPVLVNTADAGFINPRSYGVEVRCLGIPRKGVKTPDQPTYYTTLRGRKREYVHFTQAQYKALYDLYQALSEAKHPLLKLPLRVPCDAGGSLLTRTMTPYEIKLYSGAIGHYHISDNKADPGTAPLQYLADRWGLKEPVSNAQQ